MSAILKQKLIDIANGFTKYGLWKGGTEITVDSELNATSTNPVQNKVITSEIDKNLINGKICEVLMQNGYSTGSNVEILDISKYSQLVFVAVWDTAQFLDVKEMPRVVYENMTGGVLLLSNIDGTQNIQIRPVDNTHINLKCSSPYFALRVFGYNKQSN